MIDIHCHILPDVDDGAGNLSDAVEMAKLAADSGIRAIIATQHCNVPGVDPNCWDTGMEDRFLSLRSALKQRDIQISLYPGQEVFLSAGFLERLRKGELISLNHSGYLLVEFDVEETASQAYRKLRQIRAEGYTPIVAHPERYGFVMEQKEAVYRLREAGALLQVNKGSLKGRFGFASGNAADRIMRHRLADFASSDAHSQYSRTPYLADVHELICERYSADYAELLLCTNPQKVISNEPIFHG